MLEPMQFDMTPVLQRLLDEAYRVIAALPLLILALLIVWLAWLAGSWISRRAWVARASKSNPFLQDLARTTVRWIVFGLGILIALEILQATARHRSDDTRRQPFAHTERTGVRQCDAQLHAQS